MAAKLRFENEQDENPAVESADSGVSTVRYGAHTMNRVKNRSIRQKKAIKKKYAVEKYEELLERNVLTTSESIMPTLKDFLAGLENLQGNVVGYVADHSGVFLCLGGMLLVIFIISASLSSCSIFIPGGQGSVISTTYTAENEDITGANDDYRALEAELQAEIDHIEAVHLGYNEYNYNLDEIGHDPYQLASFLTVMYENYTREEVQSELYWLFEKQYSLILEEVVETRYRTELRMDTELEIWTDPVTGEVYEDEYEYEYETEVPYEYHILNITLKNYNLGHVITESGKMDENQAERYSILLMTKGNKKELFVNDPYVAYSEGYLDYDIPGTALTDTRFARMMREAERYLGYPYVWGGSSPATSFDCSGYVSWVINHCGNGWNIGRLTANGLLEICDVISNRSAKPGDLIFFQGTYNTSGASHVGIYVGSGMMIHCGNPISYASVSSGYWRQHFYCFGRLNG